MSALRFEANRFPLFIDLLRERGYRVIGPTIRDGAIIYDEIQHAEDLPAGWWDLQNNGSYRLEKREDDAWFQYNVGPTSWKKFLYPAEERLWQSRLEEGIPHFSEDAVEAPKTALLGVRSCELKAMAIQDKIFMDGTFCDERYKARRSQVLIIGVDCLRAGATCFCTSMGGGPKVEGGYDIVLTEVVGQEPYFAARTGTPTGREILAEMETEPVSEEARAEIERRIQETAQSMGRTLSTHGLKEILAESHDHPHWTEVAKRCLNCANCTLACPTCFCSTVEDRTDLTGDHAERWRLWDSCFNLSFSYLHGGSVRQSGASRYRQWMTHKLSSWVDQFGETGCVGCGRCITWCPVGIDITEEAARFREER